MTESQRNEEVRLRVFRKRGDSTIVIPEQQLHLTTSRGSGLRQIKYFKLNRGRRGSVAGKAVLGGGRGRPGGGGGWQSSESGAFSLLICFSLRSLLAGGSSVFIIKDRN